MQTAQTLLCSGPSRDNKNKNDVGEQKEGFGIEWHCQKRRKLKDKAGRLLDF